MFCGDNNDFSEFLSYIQMVKGKNAKFLKLILLIVTQSSAAGCHLLVVGIINNQSKELKVTYTQKKCLFYFSKRGHFCRCRYLNIKWDGISLLNNFEYDETGVQVWTAFNVGSCKVVPWAKFKGIIKQSENLEILDPHCRTQVAHRCSRL